MSLEKRRLFKKKKENNEKVEQKFLKSYVWFGLLGFMAYQPL